MTGMPDQTSPTLRRRVVLTGAAGRIGRAVAEHLAGRWDLVLTDRTSTHGTAVLDATDLDACRAAFAGADAVVHLAANPSPEATFDELLAPNLVGPYAVARAAAEAGVRRLVLASSLQTMLAVPEDVQRRESDQPRPANLYGATKAWTEAVGAWTAASTATSVVALRIGHFAEQRPPADADLHRRVSWLSPRDAAELVRAAVEADLPSGVEGFVVAHGISDNRHPVADVHQTRRTIGYAPVDDAWATDDEGGTA